MSEEREGLGVASASLPGIDLSPAVIKRAYLSECGTYRYRLTRHWDSNVAPMTFVMLNPSTADADLDDPTIRRCMGFAKREGAGGIVVVNLYAFRATDPRKLPPGSARIGPNNERHLHDAIMEANGRPIVCAWGTKGNGSFFTQWAKGYGANLMALGITKDGFPKHPLYIAGDAPLVPFPRPLIGTGPNLADANTNRPDTSGMGKREADAINLQWIIRGFFMSNVGATRSECAAALGISRRTVWKHLERMKALEDSKANLADATSKKETP